jgi:acyl-CoA thioesterase-1
VPSRRIFLLFLGLFAFLGACSRSPESEKTPASTPRREEPARATATDKPAASIEPGAPTVIFLGDSLTAGLGLDAAQSFPSLIQERLTRERYRYRVVNAGVSGDTAAGGLRRLEWAMSEGDPQVLIVALGGNDGLRGLPPEQLQANLAAIIEQGQQKHLKVILAGMEAPPNYGDDYTAGFRAVYPALAKKYNVPLIPFLLAGVAGAASLNQADGIHPNSRGAQIVADLVWRTLEPQLTRSAATSR